MIYLDNNATTPVNPTVIATVEKYLHQFGNPSSSYVIGAQSHKLITEARSKFGELLGISPEELIFTSCGSEADNMAIKSVAHAFFGKKKTIITTSIEHHAILHSVESLKKFGYNILYLQPDETGVIRVSDLLAILDNPLYKDDICLVSIMGANNETGMVQPVEEIGEILKKRNILFHVDGVQSVGCMGLPKNVDMVSMSGHKINAPKGIGALYVRKEVLDSGILIPFIDGGKQEFGLRGGTENLPYIMGYAKALEEFVGNRDAYKKHTSELMSTVKSFIAENIPGIKFNTDDAKPHLPNTLNVSIRGIDGAGLMEYMSMFDMFIATGSACNTGSNKPSHVLTAQGLSREDAFSSIRISSGMQNTMEEIEEFNKRLAMGVEHLRKIAGYKI